MFRRGWGFPAWLAVAAFAVAFVLVVRLIPDRPGNEALPEFDIEDVPARKKAFFDYLRPVVHYYNERIGEEREWLLGVTKTGSRDWLENCKLRQLAGKYRIDMASVGEEKAIELLERRVGRIPESLVLVQAAKESGWGRSRFAGEGNALFGERCHDAGCGIVPDGRAAGSGFEVQAFPTVGASVESYLRNLNTHDRYREMRAARQRLRRQGTAVTGLALAAHLGDYSERRDAYVAEVRAMIRQNHLESD